MSSASKPAAHPHAKLAKMRDAGHAVELVDGEIIEKAIPTAEHGMAQASIPVVLGPFRGRGGPKGPGGWWFMTEVEVLYEVDRQIYRHDLIAYRRENHPVPPSGMPVSERPDWACEILSTSTARTDIVKKQRTLHRHRVPYYWLVDPERQTLAVLQWGRDGYTNVLTAETGEVVRAEPFAELEISVAAIFGTDE